MPEYRRWYREGGTYFFTLVTADRAPLFGQEIARTALRHSMSACAKSHPFVMPGIVLLLDHIHLIMSLPPGDDDFSTRLAFIKANFTRGYLAAGGVEQSLSASRSRRGNRGVWQRRFYEHLIRDKTDLNNHLDYIHYNPVKHGLAKCPHAWEHSSFHRAVERMDYDPAWGCCCEGRVVEPIDFGWANDDME